MTTRLAVRIISMVLAVAVAVGAGLLAIEIVLALAGQPHLLVDGGVWNNRGRTLAWSDPSNVALAVLLVIIGLVLLALAWWPRRSDVVPTDVPIDDVDGDAGTGAGPLRAPVAATVRRRDLEAALTRAASGVDSITDATVRVKGAKARINVTTRRRDAADLPERVRTAVDHQARRLAVDLRVAPARVSTSGSDT
jgi:hypothetical protein